MKSNFILGNQKHLTHEKRIYIENELNKPELFTTLPRMWLKAT